MMCLGVIFYIYPASGLLSLGVLFLFSFKQLSSIPLYGLIIICLTSLQIMGIWCFPFPLCYYE